jgi:hypothetical protein
MNVVLDQLQPLSVLVRGAEEPFARAEQEQENEQVVVVNEVGVREGLVPVERLEAVGVEVVEHVPARSGLVKVTSAIFATGMPCADLLLPIIDFGQQNAFAPTGVYQWFSYLLIAAGWFLATTIAAGITRTLSRQ